MRLNIKDNHDINNIIAKLSQDDLDAIGDEVSRLCELKRQNPLEDAIAMFERSEFTGLADTWLTLSDPDYQEMIHGMLWDLLTMRVTREYAIARFLHRLSEVA